MDIKEVKEKRDSLQKMITEVMQDFEEVTGVQISDTMMTKVDVAGYGERLENFELHLKI